MSGATEYRPELYDEIPAGYYDEVFRRSRGTQWFWHQHRFATVAGRLPLDARSVIDVGCGPGTFLGNFADRVPRAVGVDIAQVQIDYARSRYARPGLEFRAGDAGSLDLAERFDALVSIEVIEHLDRAAARRFMADIQRLLQPGGTVILTTPNYRSAWPVLELLVSRIGKVDYREQHINRYVASRLVRELTESGFVDVRCSTFFVGAPFLASAWRRGAERLLDWERRWLPSWGAELIASGRKPG